MKIKQTLFFFITTFLFQTTQAQQEFGLYFLNDTWQSNKVNPAFMTDQKLTISLPGFSNSLYFTGPTYGDFTTERGDSTVIDIDAAILKMDTENIIRDEFQFETLSIAWRYDDWQFSFGHSIRSSTFVFYPKTLPQVLWQGNAQFIGETVDLSHEILFQNYHELAFGAARKIGENLTLGGKIKFLNGISSAFTDSDRHQLALTTDSEYYELAIDADYQLFSTNATRFSGITDFSLSLNVTERTTENLFTNKNVGWAFDFGATLALDKLTLSAAILDLGSINWRNDSKVFNSIGTFEYSGLDISGALTGEDVSLSNAQDTIENILKVVESFNVYETPLAPKIYLGVNYQLNEHWQIGGTYFNEKYRGEIWSGISAGLNWKAHPKFSVGASYSALFKQEEFANIGISGILKLGPVQVFAVTDNIVSLFQVDNSNIFHGRVGVNLLLNSKKNRE